MFKNLSIKNKFLVITIGSILVISSILTTIAIIDFKEHAEKETKKTIKNFIANKQEVLKNTVKTAYQLTSTYYHNTSDEMVEKAVFNTLKTGSDNMIFTLTNEYNKYKNKLSKKEMKKHLLSILVSAKYDKKRTFFAYELDGLLLASFDVPFLEGKNLWDFKDINGKFVNQAFLKPLQKDPNTPVIVDYYWIDNGEKEATKYLTYAQMFKPLNIVIGTGIGINSVTQREKNNALEVISHINKSLKDKVFIYEYNGDEILKSTNNIYKKNIQTGIKYAKDSLKDGKFYQYNNDTQMAFVSGFDKWQWMIGVSSSMDDINNHKYQIQKALKEKINSAIKKNLIIALILIVLISITVNFVVENYVNKLLQKMQNGLRIFFNYLADSSNDVVHQIDINTTDEFGQMAKMLNENISVSTKLHEEIYELNTNLEEKVAEKTAKVTTLLDNAGQGFLTFDESFLIDNEYSKECEKLLGKDISSKDISKLLFKDEHKQKIFKESLLNAIKEKMEIKRDSYISLIPKIILLNKKAVKLEYKIVDNDSRFMMILTNITSEKKLEKKVKKEQEILKMIVAIVSESEVFYEIKDEYKKFIFGYKELVQKDKTPLHNLMTLYRTVHTFKGVFSQLYMQDIVSLLHTLENEISLLQKDVDSTNDQLLELLDSQDFNKSLNTSINIIQEILGEEFLELENYIKVDLGDIVSLQQKIENILNNIEHNTPECEEILCQIQNLSSSKIVTLLSPNITGVKQLAKRLEKEIYEFNIVGDNKLTVNDDLKPFIKSLVHVFRNSVDHGIEIPEERLEKDKDEIGTISCNFEQKGDNLHIIIADDGAGIDKEKIKQKLEAKGINTTNLSENEILNHIFDDNLSTKEDITDISGRGVGMSAVKSECKRIGGEISITSSKDLGTTFEFIVPLTK